MKNKKPLIALFALLLIAGIGVTFAYFTSSKAFENVFKINKDYEATIEEKFTPEQDWLPGEEVSKEVFVTNTGSIDLVARVKYEEVWSGSLTGFMPDGTTRVALINFADNNDWVLHTDGYYYYNKVIAPETKTTSFIKSVTLNPNLELTSDYIDAEYTLNITVETIQSDGATDKWGITSSLVAGLE